MASRYMYDNNHYKKIAILVSSHDTCCHMEILLFPHNVYLLMEGALDFHYLVDIWFFGGLFLILGV
jgi:hypothetical protein